MTVTILPPTFSARAPMAIRARSKARIAAAALALAFLPLQPLWAACTSSHEARVTCAEGSIWNSDTQSCQVQSS